MAKLELPVYLNYIYISEGIISHFTSIFKNQPSSDILTGIEFLEGVRDCCNPSPALTEPIFVLEIKSALSATKNYTGIDGITKVFYYPPPLFSGYV
jgi:hypothetical protein